MHPVKPVKQQTKYDLEEYLENRRKRAEQRARRKPRGFAKRRAEEAEREEDAEREEAERDGTRG